MGLVDRLFGEPWRQGWRTYREALHRHDATHDNGTVTVTLTDPSTGYVAAATGSTLGAAETVAYSHFRSRYLARQ